MVETARTGNFWEPKEDTARAYARRKVQALRARRRRVAQRRWLTISLVVLGLALAANVARSASPAAKTVAPKTQIITVGAGETLWTVAHKYGDSSLETAERVEEISSLNAGLSGRLVPGQRLIVPVQP